MLDALYIGATGMQAQQTQVDAIANNLAAPSVTCVSISSPPAVRRCASSPLMSSSTLPASA